MKLVAAAALLLLLACGPKTRAEDPLPLPGDRDGAGTGTAAGTGTGTGADAPIDADLEAKAVAGFALLEALAGAAEAHPADCGQMSVAMQAVADGPGGTAIHDADADERMTSEIAEALFRKHGARFDAAMTRLERALQACPDQPGIDKVLAQVGLGPTSPPPGVDE